MKFRILNFAVLLFTIMSIYSCKKGCTNSSALNFETDAVKDDGSCHYSGVTFYGSYSYYGYIPISSISVSVDGENIGNLTVVYPNGPGNCSATGTQFYQLNDDKSVDWNATIQLSNSAQVFTSGTIEPNAFEDCIKVDVTE